MTWVIDVKGSPDKSLEISVLDDNFAHGVRSWGWPCADKIIILSIAGHYQPTPVDSRIVDAAMGVARELVDRLTVEDPRP